MKFLIYPLMFLSFKALACATKVDESKVMLFVDTNFSDIEIETAKRAACQRGEKLMVIPKNYKEYTASIRDLENAMKRLKACKQNCEKIGEEASNASIRMMRIKGEDSSFKKMISQELASIKKNNGRISNFILSGHDGGGTFSGYKGTINRDEITDVLSEYKDINDVTTLMLLGCYTGVQNEIFHWKGVFPKVKMIGGYDGSAPLSDKPMGHHYLEDLLVKEKQLLQKANEKQLNDYVKSNIRGLSSMHTAVYLEPLCAEDAGSENAMYYGSSTNKKFSKFDLGQCGKSAAVLSDINIKFSRFDNGEVEPPKNPSDPSIKTVYDQARSLEHCINEMEIPVDVNALFNLRFYGAVKENFATFYREELEQTTRILNEERNEWNSLEKEIDDQLAKIDEFGKKIEAENEKIKRDANGYFNELQASLQMDNNELEAMLKDPVQLATLNRMQDPNQNPSLQDTMLYNKYTFLKERINEVNGKLLYRANPQLLTAMNLLKVTGKVAELTSSKENLKQLKDNKIWLPTDSNLKSKSRKELRDNLHRIDSVLTIASLPRKTRLALEWAKQSQQQHLIHFQNPFEWHEVTGHVKNPDNKATLAQKIYVGGSQGSLFGPAPGSGMGFGLGSGLNFGQ